MLDKFARRLVYKIRHQLAPKTITLSGIRLTADPADVPKDIRKLLYRKEYEFQELQFVREALRPGERVLEAGAGIGFIGIACARICGVGNILSYEPNPAMKPVIEKNFALNGLRPNLRNKVLDTKEGEVEFFCDEGVLSSSLIDRRHGCATRVRADAIADVVATFDPHVLVMDVEGAETDLLRVCSLRNIGKMIIEMHPHVVGEDRIDTLCGFLLENGYEIRNRYGKSYYFARPGA